ncbi:MAG: DUF5107 domain-containing protein [Candidatus Latescibacterota bacterium]
MPVVTVDTDWKYRGMQTICCENRFLRLVILPDLGAKILRLIHKPSDRNILWENPRLVPRTVPVGSSYDDNFFGGWDELFPNDEPITLNGERYPDHGELWSQPWRWRIEENSDKEVVIHLWCFSSILNVRVEKWLSIEAESPIVRFHHRIQNQGHTPVDFLWKLHPALAISPNHRIDLPPCRVLRVDETFSDLAGEEQFDWPHCRGKKGGRVDLRMVPAPESPCKEFVYCTDLADGWCAFTDTAAQVGFGLRFPKDVFRSVWLFLSYGGWRGCSTAVIEPCTAWPKELDTSIANGTCSHLDAGEALECEVEAVVYHGFRSVKEIRAGGEVIGE